MNLKIELSVVYDDGSTGDPMTLDLAREDHLRVVLVSFGNGIFEEARAVAHSKAAAFRFIRIVQGGGYGPCQQPPVRDRILYEPGDACFPSSDPFVFVSPSTLDGGQIDFSRLEDEIQTFAADLERDPDGAPADRG